jgi:hypothetical protein
MHFLFLSKVPANEPAPVPQKGPYEDSCPFRGSFYISLKVLVKISLNKEIFPFSQRP